MANPVKWGMDLIKRFNHAIWHTPLSEISKWKVFLFKQIRIVVLATRGFSNDKVQLRASALTFYSVLAVVPIAAIAFAIAKGFSLDQNLEQLITEKFQAHQEVLNWLLQNARNALNWQLTALVYYAISWVLVLLIIGLFLPWLIVVLNMIFCLVAAIRSSKGEKYKYPLTI